MNPEFRASIQRAMKTLEADGFVCRLPTPEEREQSAKEVKAYLSSRPKSDRLKYVGGVLSFEQRLKQVFEVKAVAKEKNITIADACEEVGITFTNYRSVLAAHNRGKTHR